MAKEKVYYWRGKGELLGCKVGERVPTSKMHKSQFDKMVDDGRLQETAFDIVEGTGVVADLKKQVKKLSTQIVEMNKSDDKAKITELTADLKEAEKTIDDLMEGAEADKAKISELEKLIEQATGGEK